MEKAPETGPVLHQQTSGHTSYITGLIPTLKRSVCCSADHSKNQYAIRAQE